MFIHELTESECRQLLKRAAFGRLACARDNQPYVVPIYFVLAGEYIYAFTTLGQKIEWMRANPQVCLEVDERTAHDEWQSVVVFGRYEELLDLPRFETARQKALEVLQQHVMWWQPAALGPAHRDVPHSEAPIFYRIRIVKMTGHRATPDPPQLEETEVERTTPRDGWWSDIMRHIGIKN